MIEWLGFRRNWDFTKSALLGGVLGGVLTLLVGGVVIGALAMLVQFLGHAMGLIEDPDGTQRHAAIRNIGLVLAAAFGAPFVAWRSLVAQRQAVTAEQGLITERINKAVAGLGEEKSFNRLGRTVRYTKDGVDHSYFEWMDDPRDPPEHDVVNRKRKLTNDAWVPIPQTKPNLEVRIGAIYALERISQDSPRDHVQIMEILCAYIRENAPASGAKDHGMPEWEPLAEGAEEAAREAHKEAWRERVGSILFEAKARKWAQSLKPATEIQAALRVLGRRTEEQIDSERADKRYGADGYQLDLRDSNLQSVDLAGLDLRRSLLTGARMEGANLRGARMEGAFLREAWMEGANLREARMEGANLSGARMEGASLGRARMEGAILSGARMEGAYLREAWMEGAILSAARFSDKTNFSAAVVQYAVVKSVDLSMATLSQDQVNSLYGDGTVQISDDVTRPAHWPEAELGGPDFYTQWRAWQVAEGYRKGED